MSQYTYRPPEGRRGIFYAFFAGLLMTAGIFLAIPLSQMLDKIAMPVDLPQKTLWVNQEQETQELDVPDEPIEPEEEPEPEEIEFDEMDAPLEPNMIDIPLGAGLGGFVIEDKFDLNFGGTNGGGLLDQNMLDQKPTPVSQMQPRYPRRLAKQRISGVVVLEFMVDAQGKVSDVSTASSPHPDLSREAEKAVRKWKFRPGTRGGQAVATRSRIEIEFRPPG